MTPTTATPTLAELALTDLFESPLNPRKHWDQGKLEELAQSIREKGLIEPIVVRPATAPGGGYEILAGSRRFRAAALAGLAVLPALIRPMDDLAALELMVVENSQREDVHPLDEAGGYQALLDLDRAYNASVVAAKVGKSESYVYRRLKLLQLIPPVAKAFEADALTVAHAERLARLTPELQQRAFDDVLFAPAFRFIGEDEREGAPNRDALEPLARLDRFIQEHTALDPESEDARQYFPELEEQIQEAIENESPDQSDGSKPATLLQLSEANFVRQQLGLGKGEPAPLARPRWHEVKTKKDRCENVVAGVIVHGGPLRAVNVCATKGCPKHFPIAKKKKPTAGATSSEPRIDYKAQEEQRKREEQAWKELLAAAAPELVKHTATIRFDAALVRATVQQYDIERVETTFGLKLTDKTAAQVLALSSVDLWNRGAFLRSVKPMKFNLGAVEQKLKTAQKKASADTPAKAARAKKVAPKGKR